MSEEEKSYKNRFEFIKSVYLSLDWANGNDAEWAEKEKTKRGKKRTKTRNDDNPD